MASQIKGAHIIGTSSLLVWASIEFVNTGHTYVQQILSVARRAGVHFVDFALHVLLLHVLRDEANHEKFGLRSYVLMTLQCILHMV